MYVPKYVFSKTGRKQRLGRLAAVQTYTVGSALPAPPPRADLLRTLHYSRTHASSPASGPGRVEAGGALVFRVVVGWVVERGEGIQRPGRCCLHPRQARAGDSLRPTPLLNPELQPVYPARERPPRPPSASRLRPDRSRVQPPPTP